MILISIGIALAGLFIGAGLKDIGAGFSAISKSLHEAVDELRPLRMMYTNRDERDQREQRARLERELRAKS